MDNFVINDYPRRRHNAVTHDLGNIGYLLQLYLYTSLVGCNLDQLCRCFAVLTTTTQDLDLFHNASLVTVGLIIIKVFLCN